MATLAAIEVVVAVSAGDHIGGRCQAGECRGFVASIGQQRCGGGEAGGAVHVDGEGCGVGSAVRVA
ncbi:hypothetical protein D3C79_539020 [compost metagenome]